MTSAFSKAIELIFTANKELLNILGTTAITCLSSSLIALLIGVPLGIWLGSYRFKARHVFIVINRTLMAMPPVVCGLIFYLLFSGIGPLGGLKLLFTVPIMIIAQVCLITPIVTGTIESHLNSCSDSIRETAKGLGISGFKTFILLGNESIYQIFYAYLLAFARAIAEVGAVSMVGGAIAWKTNLMTTAIMQYTSRGNFSMGIALGIILIFIALVINIIMYILQRRVSK